MTPITDGLTVLERFTCVNDRNSSPASMTLTKEPDGVEIKLSFTSVNDTGETQHKLSNSPTKFTQQFQ
jgi:hypothetical protein